MGSAALGIRKPRPSPEETAKRRSGLAYKAVMVLSVLYYARPEDVIPGLNVVPLAKIAGGIALIALIFGVSGQRAVKKLPVEIKLLFAMLAQLILSIPFAYWKGGAFQTVVNKFSKCVIVALLVTLVVKSMMELKKLLWVQAAALSVMTLASVIRHPPHERMGGVLGGVFENPNDLAINIALNWPLCFAFLLLADKAWKKALWAGAMFIMAVGVVMTYSRSGFLAIVVCALISLYHFGIKGRRYYLVGLAGAACVVLAIAAPMMGLYPKAWLSRMESTVAGNFQGSFDNGSREARTELLAISLRDMAEHPIIGVGPGNFAAVSGTWRVAHNTYTELGAEGGIPALILFLLILSRAFINLRRVSRSVAFKTDLELKIFAGAMWASCAAYLVGAAFSDTQYELFPYFMVAYTTALYHMACVFPRPPKDALPDPDSNKGSRLRQRLDYGESRKTEVVGSR